jgi:hypothetical protein
MIGGAARSGKTILAARMLAEYGLSYFSIDTLIAKLASSEPRLGLEVSDGPLKRAKIIWPTLRKIASEACRRNEEFLLEGDALLPSQVMELGRGSHTGLKACFIGYADVDPARKLRTVRHYAQGRTYWTDVLYDTRLLELIGELRTFSEYIRRECGHYKIPYFDGSVCFAGALRDAQSYLRSGVPHDFRHTQHFNQSSLRWPK